MKDALLLLLLSLGGGREAAPPPDASSEMPAALVQPAGLAEIVPGKWAGEWTGARGLVQPVVVKFVRSGLPGILFAELTVMGPGAPRLVRRHARLVDDTLRLALPDGADVVLRLEAGERLVGGVPEGSLRLAREPR